VATLLAKKPDDRVPSAGALVERIDAVVAELGLPMQASGFRGGPPRPASGALASTVLASGAASSEVSFGRTVSAVSGTSASGGSASMEVRRATRAARQRIERALRGLVRRVPVLRRPIRVGGAVVPLYVLLTGGFGLALLGALLAVVVMPARSGRRAAPAGSSAAIGSSSGTLKSEDVKHLALVRRAEGGDRTALSALEALPAKQKRVEDARALGKGYFAASDFTSGLAAYKAALQQFPAVRSDPELLTDVRRAAEQSSTYEEALRFAAHQLGDKGLDLLWDVWVATRNKPEQSTINRRVRQFLDDSAVREHATRELSLVFELERAEKRHRCADAKAALPKAGEYGDARLVPILDRFKLTRGCGFVDLGDCWECLRGTKDLARVRDAAEARPAPTFTGR
jgi:hypothetical protein